MQKQNEKGCAGVHHLSAIQSTIQTHAYVHILEQILVLSLNCASTRLPRRLIKSWTSVLFQDHQHIFDLNVIIKVQQRMQIG